MNENAAVKRTIIFGNQAVAVEAYYALTGVAANVVAFTVDGQYVRETELLGRPVVPFEDIAGLYLPADHHMFVAVGYVRTNKLRAERLLQAKKLGYRTLSVTAPTAIVSPDTIIGENCVVGHYSTISPNARIGNNVVIGNHCSIGHDVTIGDHCFLSNDVAISGRVTIGEYCYLGTNCTIRNSITVAPSCVIGAGALILESTEPRGVYLGAAATQLPINSDELSLG